MPAALTNLDNRVLGNRGRRRERSDGDDYDEDRDARADRESRPQERTTIRSVEREPEGERPPKGDGVKEFLTVFYRITRLVFLLLALVVVVGIIFILAPTNMDNSLVQNVLDLADTVAGPFRDVFTADDPEREMVINYGFAAVIYFVASVLVTKLPGSKA